MIQPIRSCLVQGPTDSSPPEVVHNQPTPRLDAHEVLVLVHAVALNPTDFKMPKLNPCPGAIMGCDFTGTVVSLGADVDRVAFTPGTRVCGAVHGSNPARPDEGAFATYVRADSRVLLRIPEGWSDGEAAALGASGWAAAALCIEEVLRLKGRPSCPEAPREELNGEKKKKIPVLVYGGGTASGTMACQLLLHSGYDPIVTVSDASAPLARAYGAATTYPYIDPKVGQRLRQATKGRLRHAIDCIASAESAECCYGAIGRPGGRYASLEHVPAAFRESRKVVSYELVLAYQMNGRELALQGDYYRAADPGKAALASRWRDEVQGLVDRGMLKAHPVRELEGKWDGILRGIQMLQEGRVRGEKLVVRLLDL